MILSEAKIGDRVQIPIDHRGYLTYDYDGSCRKKGQTITVSILGKNGSYSISCGLDKRAAVRCKNVLSRIDGSRFAGMKESSHSEKFFEVSSGVPCIPLPAAKKPSLGFLFACLGAGAALNNVCQAHLKTETTVKKEARS